MPQVPIWVCVLIAVLAAAVCGAVAFFAGVNHRKREAEAAIGSAEDEAKRIISNAIKRLPQRKRKPCSKARTKFTVCATSPNAR